MIRYLSNLLSWVLHPLWMPFYLFLTLTFHAPGLIGDQIQLLTLSVMILILTGVLPAFNLMLFRILGTIPDLRLSERKDRIIPFMFITLVYLGVTWLFYSEYPVPGAFKLLLLIAASAMAGTIMTMFHKTSIHALSCSAVTTILIWTEGSVYGGSLLGIILISVLMSGAVMSARLWLGAHTLKEIATGAATGSLIAGAGMTILF